MDISIEWPLYILGYKYVAMLLLPFEALVLFSFRISPILFCSQVIGDEFCSHLRFAHFFFKYLVFAL